MKINTHLKQRMEEKNISMSSINMTIDSPDQIIRKTKRKVLYQKTLGDRQLNVIMRKGKHILITAYWKNEDNRYYL